MPLAPMATVQADYNTGKAALATLQTAVDTAAAALLALEQSAEALENDGAGDIAVWLRQQSANTSQGYQGQGNSPHVVIYARNPAFSRDLSIPNSVGPVTNTNIFKNIYTGLIP
jgi:hypothetical protein